MQTVKFTGCRSRNRFFSVLRSGISVDQINLS
nr:MAG TPA: hypothetical protein [Caudoviricetes sp.]